MWAYSIKDIPCKASTMTCPSFTELLVACLDVRGTISSAESKYTHACWSVDRAIPICIMLSTFPPTVAMRYFKAAFQCFISRSQEWFLPGFPVVLTKRHNLRRWALRLLSKECFWGLTLRSLVVSFFNPGNLRNPISICSPTTVHSTVRRVQPCPASYIKEEGYAQRY